MKYMTWILALLVTAPAHALTYKCELNGRVEYRDRPCPVGAQVGKDIQAVTPDPEEQMRARLRAAKDIQEVKRIKAEEEAARERERLRQTQAEKADRRVAKENHAHQARCGQSLRKLERTESRARQLPDDRPLQEQATAAREKFKLECR